MNFHEDCAHALEQLHRRMQTLGLAEAYELPWPSASCSEVIQEGIKCRVAKNVRPTELRLPQAPLDNPSVMTASIADFVANRTEGYWSARLVATNKPLTSAGAEEFRPVLSHIVAASREEGFCDRELKRITLFNRGLSVEASRTYVYECLLKALAWRAGESPPNGAQRARSSIAYTSQDRSKLGQRFVSIMTSDLWTFPTECVYVLETLILDQALGQQHFDLVGQPSRHTRHGKCPCRKLQNEANAKSYVIFSSEKIIPHILKQFARPPTARRTSGGLV